MRKKKFAITHLIVVLTFVQPAIGRTAGQAQCAGKVIDGQAQPIADVKVVMYEMLSDGVAGNIKLQQVAQLLTRADGAFVFATEPRPATGTFLDGYIVTTKQGLALGWAIWNVRDDAEVTIKLGEPKRLEGVIVDEAGNPVVGAEVRANLYRTVKTADGEQKDEWLPGIAPLQELGTLTNSQGRFFFSNLPADSGVDLLVTAAGKATIYTYQFTTGPSYQAGRTDVKVVLSAEGRIAAKIVDRSTGKPVEGIKIAVVPTFSPAFYYRSVCVSGKDGSFRAGGLQKGDYLIRGDFPEIHVDVESGKTTDEVIIDCPGVAQGRVIGPAGEPIAGAVVQIREHNPGARSIAAPDVETDEQGRYVYANIRWAYTIGVLYREDMAAGGHRFQYLRRNQVFDNSQTVDFQFEQFPAGTAAISGRVAGPDSKALTDFTVHLSNKVDWNNYSGGYLHQYGYQVSFSDVDGQLRIDNLPAGQYGVGAYKSDGTYTFPSREVVLQERAITNVTFEPTTKVPAGSPAGATKAYYGRVLFDDGTPAAFDPGPWRRAKVHVDVLQGSGDVDDKGYFRADLAEKEFDSLVAAEATYGIYCPVPGEEGVSTQVAAFPVKLLSPDKSQAGVVKIFKPTYKPRTEPVTAPSLKGKLVPTFDGIEIKFDAGQAENRAILVCFFDMNQRPSRHLLSELANRAEDLKGKGLTILAVQSSKIDERALVDWVKKYNIPFPVGMVQDDEEKTRFAWGVKSLPWLILTDRDHVVTAEGFAVTDIGDKLK